MTNINVNDPNLSEDIQAETETKAVVRNGKVVNLIAIAKGDTSFSLPGFEIVDIEPGVNPGDDFDPAAPVKFSRPAVAKERLLQVLKDARKAYETGGVDFNGMRIATDRESQAMITGARSYLVENPSERIKFKSENGFVDVDKASVNIMGTVVARHVQTAFKMEAELMDKIANGEITTEEEIGNFFFPPQLVIEEPTDESV